METALKLDPAVQDFVRAPFRKMLIDGKWVASASGKTFDTVNPATGEVLARVAEGDGEDVERAVRAARRAFDDGGWPQSKPAERTRILLRIADLIEQHADEIAQLETLDNGKSINESRNVDVPAAAGTFRYYAGWVDKVYGQTIPSDPSFFNFTLREPVGVCGQIIPWNFPLLMAAWKLGPALACGNTVVLKPAEQTPLTALRLGELMQEAGLPDGVVNVVPGFGPSAGGALVRHPQVDKIAFTGSTEVGKEIHRETAGTLKRVSLELGGKSPNIVFDDADFDQAVHGALSGVFSASGQTCVAGSRLLLQESIHDAFVERIASLTNAAVVGDPADPKTQIGPITTRPQFDKVMRYIEIARQDGARCVAGGQALSGPGYGAGQLVQPTIFVDVTNAMRIAQEEVFGPVLSVLKFRDEEDAIRIANDIRFGLAAGVWTQSLHRAMLMSERLRAGTIWINNYRSSSYTTPFGGFKDSGIGREGGIDAVREYMEPKSVWISSDLPMANPFARK